MPASEPAPQPAPRPARRRSLGVALELCLLFVAIAQLPLLGAWLAGLPLEPFHEVLPRLGRVRHAPRSWLAFGLLASAIALTLLPFALRWLRWRGELPPRPGAPGAFPRWGWAGVALLAASWALAWTRIPALAPLQEHTFTPLWVGYVLVVNAWSQRRTGECPLRHRGFWLLVPLSAVFWWFFEYLNRFVESWDYHGAEFNGAWDVLLHGTLPFATVLPAVVSTQDLLATYPRLTEPFRAAWAPRVPAPRALAALVLLLSALGLVGLSWAPNLLFPLPWLAPLFLLLAARALVGARSALLEDVSRGDWRPAVTFALGAVICGLCWEVWNVYSQAKWTYTIPYVQALHVGEMPLLGFAGYPPFGLECAVVAGLVGVHGRWRFRAQASA